MKINPEKKKSSRKHIYRFITRSKLLHMQYALYNKLTRIISYFSYNPCIIVRLNNKYPIISFKNNKLNHTL